MAIAPTLKSYLDDHHIHYDTLSHRHSSNSMETAATAKVPLSQLAKAVVFRDENRQYLMAVVPSLCRAEVSRLNTLTAHQLSLAEERELGQLFGDCEVGAVPPLGTAYDVPVIWDERLGEMEDLYLEAGDHENLVHLKRGEFTRLMAESSRGRFCQAMIYAH
ncbi:MAG: YbaK/EbsC family protein [Pseudomonadota bacterium]|nr:YbaK/EbsC family protein [Pseudomonadota bacterium]